VVLQRREALSKVSDRVQARSKHSTGSNVIEQSIKVNNSACLIRHARVSSTLKTEKEEPVFMFLRTYSQQINLHRERCLSISLLLASLCAVSLSWGDEKEIRFSEPQDISFISDSDGTEQRYVLLVPEDFDPQTKRTLLIALHGHGSDRWQFARENRPECQGARDVALKHGAIYVSPDYRAKTSWMGPKAEGDLIQIIRSLQKQYPLNRVLLCGGSMGGSSGLTFTALHPDMIDGVVAMNGTANHLEYEMFQDAIAESFGGTKQALPEEYKRRSAEYWPERLLMPIALTTGGKDTLVPPDSTLRLGAILKKINPHVLQLHTPEGGHSTTYEETCTALEFVFEHAHHH